MQHKKKEIKEEDAENLLDLTFCFESITILEEAINKLNYIGKYTYSYSANVMSNSIGQQIEQKMQTQRGLEKKFQDLIAEKMSKTDLLDESEIKNLIGRIQACADELKKSTNDICKSLAENPDIPTNLKKAEVDKEAIVEDLNKIKTDLYHGGLDQFEERKLEIIRESINIEEKRNKEMALFKELRTINEEFAREEEKYSKELKGCENRLTVEKKKLAKTKMEESIFRDYRKNQLEALKILKKTNFSDSEASLQKEINDKTNEKDNISKLDTFVLDYMKEKTKVLQTNKDKWETKKNQEDVVNTKKTNKRDDVRRHVQEGIKNSQKKIDDYNYEMEKLKNLAHTLNPINVGSLKLKEYLKKEDILPPINPIPDNK